MGIILDALAGAGNSIANSAADDVKNQQALDMQKVLEDARMQHDQSMAKFNQDLAIAGQDQQRTAMVDRIGAAKTGIVNGRLDAKYGDPVLGDTPLTPDQQAVMDNGMAQQARDKEADRQSLMADPNISNQAGIQTGDIDPKTAATLGQKSDATMAMLAARGAHDDTLLAMNANAYDTKASIAAGAAQTRELVAAMNNGSKADRVSATDKLSTQLRDVNATLATYDKKTDPSLIADTKALQTKILKAMTDKFGTEDAATPATAGGLPVKTSASTAEPAPAASAPKAGATKQITNGPNAGKMAVFDGKGWKLQ